MEIEMMIDNIKDFLHWTKLKGYLKGNLCIIVPVTIV